MRGCILVAALFTVFDATVAVRAQERSAEQAVRTTPLSLRGRARDEQGEPIGGATIYVVSTNGSPARLLGQTTTDENGNYEFTDLPLPESRSSKPAEEYGAGCFQVFGKAPARAFAWRGMRFLYVNPKSSGRHGFFAGDEIKLDLTFEPARKVEGRIVDETGTPIPGVKVQLGRCDWINLAGKEDHVNFREFWAVYQAAEVMPEELFSTTDQDGRFAFKSVPMGVICRVGISHADYAYVSLITASAAEHPATYQQQPVLDGPLNLTLKSVRKVAVRVVRADTDEPLTGARVSASENSASGSYAYGVADKEGKLVLKLPPGTYELTGSPPKELDLIETTESLTVDSAPAEQSITLKTNLGCVLILKAIDADTGAGIAEVTFSEETKDAMLQGGRRGTIWSSVQSHTTFVNNPKTNADGELRAVVVPGARRYGVGFTVLPDGYRAVDFREQRPGRLLELPAGGTVVSEYKLRKVGR